LKSLLKELADILNIKTDELLEKNKDSKEDLVFEAEVFYGDGINIEKDVGELLLNLKEEYLKEELSRKMQELHLAEEKKNQEKAVQILKEINEITSKIQNIKNEHKTNI